MVGGFCKAVQPPLGLTTNFAATLQPPPASSSCGPLTVRAQAHSGGYVALIVIHGPWIVLNLESWLSGASRA